MLSLIKVYATKETKMYKNPVTVIQSLSWVDDYFALKNNYNFKYQIYCPVLPNPPEPL